MKITNNNYRAYSEVNFKNVYLNNNRIMTEKTVKRELNKIEREAIFTEMMNSIKRFIKRIFKK